MTRKRLTEILEKEKPFLEKEYGVERIALFGSFADGTANDKSDVDLLIEFREPIDFNDFLRLEDYLEAKLGRKVDLLTKGGLETIRVARVAEEIAGSLEYV